MRLLRTFVIFLFFAFSFGGGSVTATVITTQWGGLIGTVSGSIEYYANTHNGELPPDLDSLYTGSIKATLEEQLGGPISSKITYLRDSHPKLDSKDRLKDGVEVLALIAFPISEDRRAALGRYIVYRRPNGQIGSFWEEEESIQASLRKANVVLPVAPIYHERPLKAPYPEHGMRLVEDAVKQGVPIEQALKVVEKHVDDVANRRAKQATTWAELVAATPSAPVTAPERSTPAPLSTPQASQVTTPASTPAQTFPASTERRTPVWPWVVGIVLLLVIVSFVVKLRP